MFPLRRITLATLSTFALLAASRPAGAQRVLGIGDDASTLPRGVLRVTAGVLWERANERYDADGKLHTLGASTSASVWNGRYDPRLAAADPLVVALSGLAGFIGMLSFAREVYASVASPVWQFAPRRAKQSTVS